MLSFKIVNFRNNWTNLNIEKEYILQRIYDLDINIISIRISGISIIFGLHVANDNYLKILKNRKINL